MIWLIWNCDTFWGWAWIGGIWNVLSSNEFCGISTPQSCKLELCVVLRFFREFLEVLVGTIYLRWRGPSNPSMQWVSTASLLAEVLNFMPAISGLMVSTQDGQSFFMACFRHWIGDSYCSILYYWFHMLQDTTWRMLGSWLQFLILAAIDAIDAIDPWMVRTQEVRVVLAPGRSSRICHKRYIPIYQTYIDTSNIF